MSTATAEPSLKPSILTLGLANDAMSGVEAAAAAFEAIQQKARSNHDLIEQLKSVTVGCAFVDEAQLTVGRFAQLNSVAPQVAIIAVQKKDSANRAVELMKHGAVDVLTCPINKQTILDATVNAVRKSERRRQLGLMSLEATSRLACATKKEREVLHLILLGKKNKEIAVELGITVRAVEDRRFRLMKKIGVDSLAELVEVAVVAQLIESGLTPARNQKTELSQQTSAVAAIEIWQLDTNQQLQRYGEYQHSDHTENSSDQVTHLEPTGLTDEPSLDVSANFVQSQIGRYKDVAAMVKQRFSPVFLADVRQGTDGQPGLEKQPGATQTTAPMEPNCQDVRDHESQVAIGLPIFDARQLRAIVIVVLKPDPQVATAAEVWNCDRQMSRFSIHDNLYVNCHRLKNLTQCTFLPADRGFCSLASDTGLPQLAGHLAENRDAIRGINFAAEGLVSSLALPLTDRGDERNSVALLFNSLAQPLFSVMQVWTTTETRTVLKTELINGVTSPSSRLPQIRFATCDLLDRCLQSRLPQVASADKANDLPRSPGTPDLQFALAIPTIKDGQVSAVSVLAAFR